MRKVHNLLWACRRACGAGWCEVRDTRRSTGSMWPSFGRPSPFHPYYGGQAFKRLVPRRS